jgi:NAD(P)H-flavin reductase
MTATSVRTPEPDDPADQRASETARLIKKSLDVVAPKTGEVTRYFYSMLFTLDPGTRDLFPVNMELQRSRLFGALVHIVQQVDRLDALTPYLHQLGRDHRKFGVISRHFEALGIALISAVKRFAGDEWSDEIERAWAEAYTTVARAMQDSAAADENPAWWPATVVSHERVGRDIAVITVRTEYPVPYRPGQYLSVETPQRERLWRYLTPAGAPAEDGTIEFHVRSVADGWVSRSIVAHTKIGDTWKLGAPIGSMTVNRESGNDVLMVAGGTGLAPMRSLLQAMAEYGENPNVHLFYGARRVEDLHDLDNLRQLAAVSPWLTVTPVVDSLDSFAGASGDVKGVYEGTLADVVPRFGAWKGRDVLIAGSPPMLRATVAKMLVAGTPLDRIQYDPYTLD